VPWYGQRSGKDAVARFFADVSEAIDVLKLEPQSFAANEDEVMVLLTFAAKVKETGRDYEMNLHHYWRFSDGKIDRFRGSEDSQQTAGAFAA